jgi:hypothetical protein
VDDLGEDSLRIEGFLGPEVLFHRAAKDGVGVTEPPEKLGPRRAAGAHHEHIEAPSREVGSRRRRDDCTERVGVGKRGRVAGSEKLEVARRQPELLLARALELEHPSE